jgi:hypothetical protein
MALEGAPQLKRRLNAVASSPKSLPRAWAPLAVRLAKQRVARKTGTTARTIRIVQISNDEATMTVGGAGVYLEKGTRPHIIRPRRRSRLVFPAAGSQVTLSGRLRKGGKGRLVFARVVHHPGTKAQPFFFQSARDALAIVGTGRIAEDWNNAA